MQEFTKKLASYVFDMPVILDKYFQLQNPVSEASRVFVLFQ